MAASLAPLRRVLTPRLSGISPTQHIALTYDDGQDPATTPAFIKLLSRHDVRATFFLVGEHAWANPRLVKQIAAEGHELGVHGWTHRCVALQAPGRLTTELRRTRHLLTLLGGREVTWYRPPYGILTTEALVAAGANGLTPVLWSAWGWDWSARATPTRIVRTIDRTLRPGGTVLLHDTDRESTPGSWLNTLAASEHLLTAWQRHRLAVGPLGEHWDLHPVAPTARSVGSTPA